MSASKFQNVVGRWLLIIKSKINHCVDWISPILFNHKMLLGCALLWVLFQLVYVYIYHYTDLLSDPGLYVYRAQECVKHGTMYPDYSSYHDEYIHNPGWINIIILWIKLFGSVNTLPYLSITLNVAILFMLYKVALIITQSKKITYIVLYLFMLLPSNSTVVLHARSEMSFEFFSMLSFYLILTKRYWCIFLAGIAVALAQWIRPLGIAWMVAGAFYLIYKERRYKALAVYVLPIAFTLSLIAVSSTRYFPRPIVQASTGGVNFIMGANDWATGGYCGEARTSPQGLGYLPGLRDSSRYIPVEAWRDSGYLHPYSDKYTYREVDSIYMARGMKWIGEHPMRWTCLTFKKTALLFYGVSYFGYSLNKEHENDFVLRNINRYGHICSILFRIISAFAFLGLITPFWRRKEYIYCIIPIVISTAVTVVTCICTVYNFIFMPQLLIFATYSARFYYKKYVKDSICI